MTQPLPANLLARLDQESAAANEGVNGLVEIVRLMLDDEVLGVEPNVAAQLIAVSFQTSSHGRLCTALGYALVRLARQDDGGWSRGEL